MSILKVVQAQPQQFSMAAQPRTNQVQPATYNPLQAPVRGTIMNALGQGANNIQGNFNPMQGSGFEQQQATHQLPIRVPYTGFQPTTPTPPSRGGILDAIGHIEDSAVAHVERPFVKAWQTLNPSSGYNQAKPVVQQAQSQYKFTPGFSAIVNGGNPAFTNNFGQNGNLEQSHRAAAEFIHQNPVNQIQLGNGYGDSDTLVHEALHRQWQINPATRSQFAAAYMQGANPQLRSYLAQRLSGYKSFDNGPTTQLMDINQAAPDIQNEIHSYIPQYYAANHMPMTGSLAAYYSQFFSPTAAFQPPHPVAGHSLSAALLEATSRKQSVLDMLSRH